MQEPLRTLEQNNTEDTELIQRKTKASIARERAEVFFQQKEYLKSQAWLVQAILLGDDQSDMDFCSRGMIKDFNKKEIEKYLSAIAESNKIPTQTSATTNNIDGEYTYKFFLTILTALILSGKKLSYFNNLKYKNDSVIIDTPNAPLTWIRGPCRATIIKYANTTKNPVGAIYNEDTMLYKIAGAALKKNPRCFFDFMTYCAQQAIFSLANYKIILDFIKCCMPDEHFILEEGNRVFRDLASWEGAGYHLPPLFATVSVSSVGMYANSKPPVSLTTNLQPIYVPTPY